MKKIIVITIKCFQKSFHINNIKIPYYEKTNISEGIDINTTGTYRECIICHYWNNQIKDLNFNKLLETAVIIYCLCL